MSRGGRGLRVSPYRGMGCPPRLNAAQLDTPLSVEVNNPLGGRHESERLRCHRGGDQAEHQGRGNTSGSSGEFVTSIAARQPKVQRIKVLDGGSRGLSVPVL